MNRDDIQRTADEALSLAKTDFAAAEKWLLELMPQARAADQDAAEDDRYSMAIVFDSLATLYTRKAADYWNSLVDQLGGPEAIGTCWTGESFGDYCGDRSGLSPWE